jgi:hypothetical protein
MLFNDRRATKRALKAANGPALTADSNLSDATSRGFVHAKAKEAMGVHGTPRKKAYEIASDKIDNDERATQGKPIKVRRSIGY